MVWPRLNYRISALIRTMARLWILLSVLPYVTCVEIEDCNKTIDTSYSSDLEAEAKVTFKHVTQETGKPYYCWYRLHGNDDQYVIVNVRTLVAGKFDSNQCQDGYLRVSDDAVDRSSSQWLPPTTICGNYPDNHIRVKRLTRGSSAFVEFHVDKAERSQNYEFDAMFVDKEPQESLPYGHIQRTDGKLNSSRCDWLVPVDTCFGGCKLVSPGYPGIYPPNITCHYTLINFEHARVQVTFGGKHGKFDIKRSDDCNEDYLVVYDGRSSESPLIGRYCGLDTEFIISTGTSLYMEFHTKAGGPPYDYSGFEINVVDRWKNEHDYGTKEPESVCDWTFLSRDSVDGDLHTPDHMIPAGTTCLYKFIGEPGEILEVRVKAYELKPDCVENLEVLDGDTLLDRICADRIKSRVRGTSFSFTTTSNTATVRYRTRDKRISNSRPAWIYYTFRNATEYTGLPESASAHDRNEADDSETGYASLGHVVTSYDVMLLSLSVLLTS